MVPLLAAVRRSLHTLGRSSRREPALLVVGAAFLVGAAIRVWFVAELRPAFLGYSDAHGYVAAADEGLGFLKVHPLGYPLFLRVGHLVSTNLTGTIIFQHALGLATAALLYLATLRTTGSRLAALIPASFILFDGLQIVLEHTAMSESLFVFLVAGFVYTAVRSIDDEWPWAMAAGGLAAASGTVKSVGLLLVPLAVLTLLPWRRGGRGRVPRLAVLAAFGAGSVLCAYLVVLHAEPRSAEHGSVKVSLSPAPGRVLYSRVAPFADCDKFEPPGGTERFCENTPRAMRPGTNFYLHDPDSPASRLYRGAPAEDSRLRAFALAVILHQPGDYLSAVSSDFRRYFDSRVDLAGYVGFADNHVPLVASYTHRYYSNTPKFNTSETASLLAYARTIMTKWWLMLSLIVVPALSLAVTRGSERRGVVIFAATGWALLLGAVATANYDPRYGVVAIGPLAAGAAPAVRYSTVHAHQLARAVMRRLTSRGSKT